MTPIKRFAKNVLGRDFVVGDIHGMFGMLSKELSRIDFDVGRDRIFCVGDLIDRGDDSAGVIEWLRYPWFHSVRGNHEDLLVKSVLGDASSRAIWRNNGGDWWDAVDMESRGDIYSLIADLPWVIEVESESGAIGIVHADVPAGYSWTEFVNLVELFDEKVISHATWARTRATAAGAGVETPVVSGVSRIFCGHHIQDDFCVARSGNIYFIDTGAFMRQEDPAARLTVLELSSVDPAGDENIRQ